MSKEFTKEDVIKQKKASIKEINNLLEKYINTSSEKYLKKANLISYWLSDFARFINFEEKFIPTKNISYKRGNIVKVNFGFNIGSEYGGLHYAIVLDNKNAHNSPVVTVIPLTSIKSNKPLHDNNVNLGNEVYRLLKLKYITILNTTKEDLAQSAEIERTVKLLISSTESMLSVSDIDFDQQTIIQQNVDKAIALKNDIDKKINHILDEIAYLEKINDEISRMKEGSIALVSQITTVSKMRIYNPKNSNDVLSGVSLSSESMEKINAKVKELYIFA